MAYYEMKLEDIKENDIFVSLKELRLRTGVPRSTLNEHIHTNKVNAFRFRNRTYFKKEDAAGYEKLFKCGLLG